MYLCVYTYTERERERDVYIHIYIYICIYIHTHILYTYRYLGTCYVHPRPLRAPEDPMDEIRKAFELFDEDG